MSPVASPARLKDLSVEIPTATNHLSVWRAIDLLEDLTLALRCNQSLGGCAAINRY